jgi:hypothetical protein
MNNPDLLARRLSEIRQRLYGDEGVENLARALGIRVQTWLNYERGVTMPAHVLLDFLQLTGADPQWLLTEDDQQLAFGIN